MIDLEGESDLDAVLEGLEEEAAGGPAAHPRRYAWQSDVNRAGTSKRARPCEYPTSDVVRCKEARRQMTGHECAQCRQWYQEVAGQSVHARHQCAQQFSRHRTDTQHSPPATPPGIWDLTFPPTQEK